MGARRGRTRPKQHRQDLRDQLSLPVGAGGAVNQVASPCKIVSVGKRRDGGTRYWCLTHRADATAKYGRRAAVCRFAHVPMITERETVALRLDNYPGGVALWGAVAPVYDTTLQSLDRGIHIHARSQLGGDKEMDRTVRAVCLFGDGLPSDGVTVSELDAIYYMVSSVFGYETKQLACTYCRFPHLDRDWFSVHPHQRHLCAGCGSYFRDNESGIGNPIQFVRAACRMAGFATKPAGREIDIRQSEYLGGIQIWGSNPAFLWTSPRPEEEGIHLHAFRADDDECPVIDNTYSHVRIDGISLDPAMVRVSMAQSAMPHLRGRVLSASCPSCEMPQFCNGESGFTPSLRHNCESCGREFSTRGRVRKTILNPLPAVLVGLAGRAARRPQCHDMGLLREAP